MAGLSDYPIIMNGTALPFFPEVENTLGIIENISQSEGGRDIVQVIRLDKMSASFSLVLANFTWVKFFYQLSLMDSFIFKQYSPLEEDYAERTVRLRGFTYKNRKHSDKLAAVTGVWDVSFTLEEF